ncbi:hypothetical protein Phi4:1_gp030 [Cellulophaga phage phi4:1]|uniref:Uncharacterized protein n=3 Tax=Lightbulbvirus Cba41 TaxID=1918524 RepID=A0A0S2MWJ4_9CAUD|nr:hypothetical protein Phi4:1_gp030 [Cellulophaga phage phi4:1]AGO49443.1 hypothetical protein Phi4:1_gp030 [Cellulophaga phage phi4:1]ALO80039.1 hypothetical protein Phi4113_030 [Cellulophaga phage phi4:1_13]ALO80236.1 hypothetical protein Phi4118_030 [Cellulophaga phage phi4:1_18]
MNKTSIITGVMVFLMKQNRKTTSKEVKDFLREVFPEEKWFQNDISDAMSLFCDENTKTTFDDNGTFKTYHMKPEVIKISRTDMVDLLKNCLGTFKIKFSTKNAKKKTLTCATDAFNFMDNLGYINVVTTEGGLKKVDPKTLKYLKIDNQVYKTK